MTNFRRGGTALALAGALISGSAFAAQTVLRASHQFPGGKGDVRDEMVQIIARDVKAAGVELDVQVYPGASLFKPNEQWNALVNGQLDISTFPLDYASDTSSGSFVSFRIYEQVKCLTAPGENAIWFMYEPVLMSKKSFSRLNKAQQEAVLKAGKKSEAYFAKEAKGLDDEMVKTFKEHKVEVITLTPAEYDQWVKVARQSSYAEFAQEVPDGKKLIDAALGVK